MHAVRNETLVLEQVLQHAPAAGNVVRGLIVDLTDTGEIDVVVPPEAEVRIRCDFLHTGATPPALAVGDLVLLMRPAGPGQNGCVLGRVGRYQPPQEKPDHVVVEATESLTLKCGDSSVEMRKDGKLAIVATDVVSRARRSQRIKGGTIAIN